MNDKTKVWSDGQGNAATSEDMMSALGDEQDLNVVDMATRSGMLMTSNCKHCGRQWKARTPWSEIAMMFCGQVPVKQGEPSPWKLTRQGVFVPMGCGCGRTSPLLIDWDEIRRWVDVGIRSGALDPRILQAVGQQ
jgi:hypothetical protein